MSWADERAAFETRVIDGFSAAPVMFPGVAMEVPNGPWIKMSILSNHTNRISLGPSGRFRETGLVIFQVFTPINRGSNEARALADELAPLFHEAEFSLRDSGFIRCRAASLDDRGASQDGNWYQVNLTIDYERDTILG